MGKLTIFFITMYLIFPSSLWAEKVGSYATYKWTSKIEATIDVLNKTVSPDGKVSYKVTKESVKPKPIYLTYAILKATDKDYLVQVITREAKDKEPLSISQVVIDRNTGKGIKAVIRSPKGVPLSYPPGKELIHVQEKVVKDGKKVNITVEGGAFNCLQGTFKGQSVCVSDEFPTLGIVKATLEDGTVELVESSPTGAKDFIRKK
jgi:hypothetical protein